MPSNDIVKGQVSLPLSINFRFGLLRALSKEDAPSMLEWMHDPSVRGFLAAPFESFKLEDCLRFIDYAVRDKESLHLAITGEGTGEYLGTISLKNVDFKNGRAEYAIATRAKVHGTGIAAKATQDILRVAFDVLGLNSVYLNVRQDNLRAIRFYEKMGFVLEGRARQAMRVDGKYVDLFWLSMLAGDFEDGNMQS